MATDDVRQEVMQHIDHLLWLMSEGQKGEPVEGHEVCVACERPLATTITGPRVAAARLQVALLEKKLTLLDRMDRDDGAALTELAARIAELDRKRRTLQREKTALQRRVGELEDLLATRSGR